MEYIWAFGTLSYFLLVTYVSKFKEGKNATTYLSISKSLITQPQIPFLQVILSSNKSDMIWMNKVVYKKGQKNLTSLQVFKVTLTQKVKGPVWAVITLGWRLRKLKWLQRLLLNLTQTRMNSKDLDRIQGSCRTHCWSTRCIQLEDKRRSQRNSWCRLREQ